jgi:large subunit ribosomal protein L22
MEAIAKLKSVPISVRKMRQVVDNIRGKDIETALNLLRFTKRESAIWLEKLLLSAIANWEFKTGNLESADDYNLIIKTAFADAGSQLKRFRPAPHGRAHRIRKHSCHVTIIVENQFLLPSEEEGEEEYEEVEEVVED